MLLGRTAMQRMGILVSTIHEAIKFHTEKGIKTVLSIDEANEGTRRARKIPTTSKERVLNCINVEEKIIINDKYLDQTVTIGKQLPDHFKKVLQNLLKSNADVFVWTHFDMTGIPRTIMVERKPFNTEHKMNKYSHIKGIKQNKRGLGPDRNMAACKETEELTKARILWKAKHQTWVANPVMVKKSDGGWGICVNFTDINKAYPKDCYLLPKIDCKIESLSGFRLKCFLDAYKGYHQIQMAEEDEDKTSFYAGKGVFCYKKMLFLFKNARAIYQRLVDKVFSHQIRRNLEAYVDDMVIKSTSEKEMLKDIQETFKRFRSINMKLNPKKCSFGVEEGLFLGHLITKHGIKANHSKIKAVNDLDQPRTLKDIQSLNGKLAALSRFLSKGRVAKWAIELGKHDIVFLRREEKETSVDFLVEIPFEDNEKKEKPKEVPDSSSKWRLYTDGASNSDGSGAGLRITQEMEIEKVAIFLDSQLLGFEDYTVEHVRRNQNKKVDVLSKLASMTFEHLTKEVLVEVLTKRSIEEKEVLKVDTQERKSWMDPIHEYLLSGLLPKDTREARKIITQAVQYKLIRGNPYKRSFFTSWLHCMGLPQTDEIIKEIHEGSYGFNVEPRSLVVRIMKQGFYWPSMHREVAKAIQDCKKCKEESIIRKVRTSRAIAVGSTWPFSHWGIHIIGRLPMAPEGLQFLAIVVEQSTKSKEEKHFKEGMFADLCKELKITQSFSPITEHMEIMHHIGRQLTRSQQGWVDNLAKTLWIHRTLPKNSEKETPFSLTYGSEAVILIIKTTDDRGRVQKSTKGKESKEVASIKQAYYRNKLRKYHNARSSHPTYIVGDLVLLK
ncbi:reverse transcriptase domain-containing protein [Tanacetum coccineum]